MSNLIKIIAFVAAGFLITGCTVPGINTGTNSSSLPEQSQVETEEELTASQAAAPVPPELLPVE